MAFLSGAAPCTAAPLAKAIGDTQDDGTESAGAWYPQGMESGLDFLGTAPRARQTYVAAFRFDVPSLSQGQIVSFARLRIACARESISAPLRLVVWGAAEDDPGPCSQVRLPSVVPKTGASVAWQLAPSRRSGPPFFYHTTPNLAPIINEILARPGWGREDKSILLVIGPDSTGENAPGHIEFLDSSQRNLLQPAPTLEILQTDEDAFLGKVMLGRPTRSSIALNVLSLIPLDLSFEYSRPAGASAAPEPAKLGPISARSSEPTETVLSDLAPDTRCRYQMFWERADAQRCDTEVPRLFTTQRARGSRFVFTIQADSHMGTTTLGGADRKERVYARTLKNVAEDGPDFHLDLGDFSSVEIVARRSAATLGDALARYASQRYFLSDLCQAVPFYLVLGNHEAEQGWRSASGGDSLAVWGAIARTTMIPNPKPDSFYTGNTDSTLGFPLEDYYAWEWGDALFVVIDPFRYTVARPHRVGRFAQTEPEGLDGWDWTLGKVQYDWLYETLHRSRARWKFVLAHHMTGGVVDSKTPIGAYGRGGIDAAQYRVAHRPTFEWGGEDAAGRYVFGAKRPGWSHGPIHQMMVKEGVDIFFRGHDHIFVYETLDDIIYQTCPTPSDDEYSRGYYEPGFFSTGVVVGNPGHLRVEVSADSVRVDYVRSVLPEDEPITENGAAVRNGDVSFSYTLKK